MRQTKPIYGFSIPERRIVLKGILLISAVTAIALAHGVVLYKIDTGVRSAHAHQLAAAGPHRASYW